MFVQFYEVRNSSILQYASSHCLLCFPHLRENFTFWEERLFPPFPFIKGCSLRSCLILSWICRVKLLQLHHTIQLNTPLWLAWKTKSLSFAVSQTLFSSLPREDLLLHSPLRYRSMIFTLILHIDDTYYWNMILAASWFVTFQPCLKQLRCPC